MRIEANGHEAEVRVEGEGPALTLIHGMASNLQSWDEVAARLSKRFKVIRYDLRGHGRSQKTAGPYTIERFADDVQAILQNLGVAKSHMVGLSLGGLTAQCFALNHAHMVDKLIIIAAVANRSPEVLARLKERADKIDREGVPNVIDAALERWFTPEFRTARPDLVAKRVALYQQTDPEVFSATYRTFVEADLGPELHRIKAPTLVMTGEHDPGSSAAMARFMHKQIVGSELCIIPRLRHSLVVEASDILARKIDEFLA